MPKKSKKNPTGATTEPRMPKVKKLSKGLATAAKRGKMKGPKMPKEKTY